MGVAGLWDILRPAGKTRSLTELAVVEGFEANPDGVRGFRIGIDASIWFFHAEYGREGENPVLRTLFFRCATLMHSPFLPLFVFDGPKRPDVKRGKKINKTSHKLIPGMKAIVEAFGFEWRMAPAEAEAELAYLNRIGVIDGVLSDDVDNFLFGATTVIRNASNTLSGNRANPVVNAAGKDDKNHTKVYRLNDITNHPDVQLTRGGMILIGLMSGGDYQQGGLARCGTVTAHGLARCGFGDTLYQAANNLSREDLPAFLANWRHELRHELRTNARGVIGRKQPALAKSVPEDFPDIDILLSYTNPITSESMGRAKNNLKLTWAKEPDIGKLAATCEFYFEWGYKEAIIKRFRTVIWHSAVLRILRRAALDLDAKFKRPQVDIPSTPRKNGKSHPEPAGTPSKMITRYFSSMTLEPTLGPISDDEDDDGEPLIVKVHSSRNHVSTDGVLEYRLEIAPAQLVRIAESGIKGTRSPEGPDEWADEDDEDDNGGGKKGTKPPPDPTSHMRVWMPACMVQMVEPGLVNKYEALQEKKREKKAGKGVKKKKTAVVDTDEESDRSDEDSALPVAKKTKPKPKPTKAKPTIPDNYHDISSEYDELPVAVRAVRDLTKKVKSGQTDGRANLKTFLTTAKPANNPNGKFKTAPPQMKTTTATQKAQSLVDISDDLSSTSSRRSRTAPMPLQRLKADTSNNDDSEDVHRDTTSLYRPHSPTKSKRSKSSTNTSHRSLISNKKGHRTQDLDSHSEVEASPLPSVRRPKPKPFPLSFDDTFEHDDPFNATSPTSPVSPTTSKRKQARDLESPAQSSSDCNSHQHLNKSPRKSAQHNSPRSKRVISPFNPRDSNKDSMPVRPGSPSPSRPPARSRKAAIPQSSSAVLLAEVIEISSDSDAAPSPLLSVHPLLVARAKAIRSQPTTFKDHTQSKPRLKKAVAVVAVEDIIDLT